MTSTSVGAAPTLPDSTMINIVGHDNPYPFGKVKDAVLKLGGDFYFKHDDVNLVRIKDASGKKRYFRKQSKLIYEITPGKYVHKSFLIKTEDGLFLDKNDPNTVFVDGKPTRKDYTVKIDDVYYLKTNPNITACSATGEFGFKTDMISLVKKYYPKEPLVKDVKHLIKTDDGYIMAHDARVVLNAAGEEQHYHRNELRSDNVFQVFHKFRDSTNPQLDRIDQTYMFIKDKAHTEMCEELGMRVHKNHIDAVIKTYNDVIMLREAAVTAAIKKALIYTDDGPDENTAKVVKKIPQPWPGKYNIYTPPNMAATISKKKSRTGGLSYTVGVEIETAQGLVPNELAEKLKLRIVGDRSIGAGEYVTGILHGDDGIDLLEQQCRAIARYCLVDDKCGVHVHVGGMEDTRGVAEGDFGRHFAQYATSLGTQIEPELFAAMPPSRKPTMKHCHSIMRWKDINDDNWKPYLGALVFGPEENWKSPWSFAPYEYGKGNFNKKTKLGDYCGGRYKWLNLVHILSKSNINTCELRIFPGSTNFDKIYNYVLLSMAFVWFVENKANRIVKGGVTLNEVIMTALEKYPEIRQRLVAFYSERTAKFKDARAGIEYPKVIPKAIF